MTLGRRSLGSRPQTITVAAALTVVFTLAAGLPARAEDSKDRIAPPSASEVALLHKLLALQHPSLRHRAPAAAVSPPLTAPSLTTEPQQQKLPAIEGGACNDPRIEAAPA